MQRIDVKVGFRCNNNCRICVQAHKKIFPCKPTEQLKGYLRDEVDKYKGVVFTGGEPTIREDIIELSKYAKEIGYSLIQIQTNGRMFAYRDFCLKMLDAGANEFAVAIHGHIPELHDYLTASKGSFEQTLQGIRNLITINVPIITNTVITRSNYRHLPEVSKLLIDSGVRHIQFAFVHILGNAAKNGYSVVPKISMVEPYVKRALAIGLDKKARMSTEAIPFCLMRGYEGCIAENTMPDMKVYDSDYVIDSFSKVRKKEGKTKGTLCYTCRYYDICEGPWREYPELFGWEEFSPVTKN